MITLPEVLSVLRNVRSDEQGGHMASCLLPGHGKKRGDRNPNLHVSVKDGRVLVHCFVGCDDEAVWNEIVRRVKERRDGVHVPETPQEPVQRKPKPEPLSVERHVIPAERAYAESREAQEFVKARGISPEIAKKLRFGFARRWFSCKEKCQNCGEYGALAIPGFWNGKLLNLKYRNLRPPDRDHKWSYWTGSKQDFLYLADAEPADLFSDTISIVEGPLDAALLLSLGSNAAAIFYAGGVPRSPDAASGRFLESVEMLRSQYRHIALVGDQDAAGQAAMYRLDMLIGPGAVHVYLPRPRKDVGEAWKADPEFAEELRYRLQLVEHCPPVPRPESERSTEERVKQLLTEGAKRVGNVEIKSLALTVASQLRKALPDEEFPVPLGTNALHGIVGEFVETCSPYSEADMPALVFQVLPVLGNLFGLQRFASFGSTRHYPALFSLIVGGTSTGKGQAWDCVRMLAKLVDPDWLDNRCRASAASGEGLVRLASQATKADPRIFLTVSEMALVLANAAREGSNLSAYLRMAYDRVPLENNKSKAEIVAKDYLLSVVGHVTPRELSARMPDLDWANGAANRYIFCATRRARSLPRMAASPDLAGVGAKVREALETPDGILTPPELLDFSPRAGQLWDDWYNNLPALEGRLEESQQRVRPNALRVAAVYACLDGADRIEESHVRAAIAITDYSRASVEWILKLADADAGASQYQEITRLRVAVNKNGGQISGSELHELFKHRYAAEQRFELASKAGLKLRRQDATGGRGGKQREVWTW